MRHPDRQRIRRVRRRRFREPEQRAHHETDLRLCRSAAPDHRLLHPPRRVFINRQPLLRQRQQRRATRRAPA